MNEQNELPTEMLDAVRPIAERMSESSLTPGYDGGCSGLSEDKAMGWLEAALQAAGVPALRERIAELEAELGEANLIAEARSVVGMDLLTEADQQEARIAELEAALDLARMQAADNTALTEKAAKYAASKDSRIAELEAALAGRICEGCNALVANVGQLHLCGCQEQRNLCGACKAECACAGGE